MPDLRLAIIWKKNANKYTNRKTFPPNLNQNIEIPFVIFCRPQSVNPLLPMLQISNTTHVYVLYTEYIVWYPPDNQIWF